MKIVNVSQRSPEWLAWRAQGISASDVPIIMGASDWSTPWRLWGEKKGKLIPRDISKNPYVARGVRLEDTVRTWFEKHHDSGPLLPVCVESDENGIFRASLDGLDSDDCPVEFKVPSEGKLADVIQNREQSRPYRLYRYQVLYQMLVADNAAHGHLVFYDAGPEGNHQIFRIDRDDALLDEIRQKVLVFWSLLEHDDEPPKDPARDLFVPRPEQMADWAIHASALAQAKGQLDKLAELVEEHKMAAAAHEKALVDMMGEALLAESMGVRIARYAMRGGIDYAAALKVLAPQVTPEQLEPYRKPAREQTRTTVQAEGRQERVATPEEIAAIGDLANSFYL